MIFLYYKITTQTVTLKCINNFLQDETSTVEVSLPPSCNGFQKQNHINCSLFYTHTYKCRYCPLHIRYTVN